MSLADIITHAFAAAFLIFWGCNEDVSAASVPGYFFMYFVWKISPIIVGISFAFDIYAFLMGWPV
jgi:hypothetical protein